MKYNLAFARSILPLDISLLSSTCLPTPRNAQELPFSSVPQSLTSPSSSLPPSKPLTICSIYLPPCVHYTSQDLHSLLSQLPSPLLLVGDFNLRDPLWDNTNPSSTASALLPLLDIHHLSCLNSGIPTYERFNPPYSSRIDLSFCSISLLLSLSWTRLNHLYGSDHYPILINSLLPSPLPPQASHWNYPRADWPAFTQVTALPPPHLPLPPP